LLCLAQGAYAQLNRYNDSSTAATNGIRSSSKDRNKNPNDTTTVDSNTIPIDLYMWNIDWLGNRHLIPVDTLRHQFQNLPFTEGKNGHYNHLGNMGSPRYSRIFFERNAASPFVFTDPLDFFIVPTGQFNFTNTKSPFSNLSYYSQGNQTDGEDRFRSYFATNANRFLTLGFTFDYLYGRGMYNDQSTSYFNGTLFSAYTGDRYNMHFLFSNNHMKMAENGGIENDLYITNPEELGNSYNSTDIPTVLDKTWNRNDNRTLFLTHRYNIGFHRASADTAQHRPEFIPVTSIIHTFQWQNYDRKFLAYNTPKNYYQHDYLDNDSTRDNTRYNSLKNTVGIEFHEGFHKWAQFGLTGFVSYETRNYQLPDTLQNNLNPFTQKYKENRMSVGGILAKRLGNALHYEGRFETVLTGEESGSMELEGKMDFNFRFLGDTVRLDLHAFSKRFLPSFYYRHYHSTHYWWDNDNLSKEFRNRIEGTLSFKRLGTKLMVGIENLKDYTYLAFDGDSYTNASNEAKYRNNIAVRQNGDNIRVTTAMLTQNFKLGMLHLDNEITYQKSSNEEVLPLPKLSLYHNLYLDVKLAKVLSLELGADVRYFTKYYAYDYSPALGQFYLQNPSDRIEIGNYPIVNAYANFHLKHTRFYIMMSHINEGTGNSNYFLAPHYPINPMALRWGLSWNFFD
jgi:hypothetical protein